MLGVTAAETEAGTWHSLCKPALRVFLLALVLLGRRLSRVSKHRITSRPLIVSVVPSPVRGCSSAQIIRCSVPTPLFSPSRENAENVVSVEDKPDAVISNGHEGRYVSAAADFR